MLKVIVPIVLLLIVILVKKIPVIGGSITVGLIVCASAALLMGGIYSPTEWLDAFLFGLDRLAWVMALAVFGSIYAETQVRIGTMETVLSGLRARFGRSPKGLVSVVIFTLALSGSLLGESIASAAVIGVLVIQSLREIDLSGEQITSTIVMGCVLGSIMPPITQAIFLSASLLGMESPDAAVNVGYFTIGFAIILVCIYVGNVFVKVKSIPENLIPEKSASQIIRERWKTLIPITVLAMIIILRSGFKLDLLVYLDPVFKHIKDIKVIRGINYNVVKAIMIATVVSFFFKEVRSDFAGCVKKGCINVKNSITVQVCAAFMVGAFFAAGQIDTVQAFTAELTANVLKLGGAFSMMLVGMISGSQTTTQVSIFTFLGPALRNVGVAEVKTALAGAHLAMAGQGMPPADVVTFVVAGMVGSMLNIKVDPVKAMLYSMFLSGYFILIALICLFF
ncbi:TRAP-type C4-dicarboxylate transport system, large permease component [Dethiosulfatibacter aminovorans DSM 17477]|uniref:TRAP-type C4-dicarboxylate transport system, large permease component n=1 Tax=Dethiosulfatibacter aminovorans DSM 17477 TaxID=1121476 RepID=A0A1M6IWE7_9FIRM|nr:TRAP transporter large permease subunit [Dethiosulfatibacter aminovorans]SHJ38786.1 TRAP-type C4-dicarboxylate transport system, large permease component [Dethiosulfatibacter aminovorans DSM 17477]